MFADILIFFRAFNPSSEIVLMFSFSNTPETEPNFQRALLGVKHTWDMRVWKADFSVSSMALLYL